MTNGPLCQASRVPVEADGNCPGSDRTACSRGRNLSMSVTGLPEWNGEVGHATVMFDLGING